MSRVALCVRVARRQSKGAWRGLRAGSGVWRLLGLCYFEMTGGQEV